MTNLGPFGANPGFMRLCFCRWVGHTTMWSTTLHGVLYYIYWGIRDDGGSVQSLPSKFACDMTASASQALCPDCVVSVYTFHVMHEKLSSYVQNYCNQSTLACIVISQHWQRGNMHRPITNQYQTVLQALAVSCAVAGMISRTLAKYQPSTTLQEPSPSSSVCCSG